MTSTQSAFTWMVISLSFIVGAAFGKFLWLKGTPYDLLLFIPCITAFIGGTIGFVIVFTQDKV